MTHKLKLIELVQRYQTEEQKFINSLSEDEKAASGTLEHWSARDVLGHILAWRKRTVRQLDADTRGETLESIDDIDRANAKFYAAYQDKPWEEILAESRQVNEDTLAHLQKLTEEEIDDPQRFKWIQGRPLWRSIAGNDFSHPLSHLAQFYAGHSRQELANQMLEGTLQLALDLDDSPEWQGIAIYNLACIYALSGIKDKAIANFAEALKLNPDLAEWSKQDSDLDSVREDPAFQAVYKTL